MRKDISRKEFIKGSTIAIAGIPLAISNSANNINKSINNSESDGLLKNIEVANKTSISIFSKHLQWLNYKEMAELAAQMGFDGIDLTVRPGGHISPERVTYDLPKAVEAIHAAGLQVYTITTNIKSAKQDYTIDILRTASQLGIKNYRMGWYTYEAEKSIDENLEIFKNSMADLVTLNEQYQIHGDYENHTDFFGGSIWDLWLVLKNFNPKWIGCQFDIRHATVDGAAAWPINLKILQKYIGSITFKDFRWKNEENHWHVEDTPLGHGMVDFKRYFELLKNYKLQIPMSLHYEYPLGGADTGSTTLTIPKSDVIKAIQSDLNTLKSWIKTYELA